MDLHHSFNRKSFFKELRFVFDDKPGENPLDEGPRDASIIPVAPDVLEGGAQIERVHDAGAVEVRHESAKSRVSELSGLKLDQLKDQLGAANAEKLIQSVSLSGLEFPDGTATRSGLDFRDSVRIVAHRSILDSLAKRDLSIAAQALGVETGEVAALMADVYTLTYADKVKQAFDRDFRRAADFFATKGNEGESVKFKMTVDVNGVLQVSFPAESDFVKKYRAVEPKLSKAAEGAEKAKEPTLADAGLGMPLEEALSTLPGYKLFKGYLQKPSDPNDANSPKKIELLQEGLMPQISFILGLFGFSSVGNGEIFQTVMDFLPNNNLKRQLTGLHERAKKSKWGVENWKDRPQNPLEGEFVKADAKMVEELLAGKKPVPEKGIKLEGDFKLPDSGVKFDLAQGGKITLPSKASIMVDGKTVTIPSDKIGTYEARHGEITIQGTIPAGTVLLGQNIKFGNVESAPA